MQIGTLLCGYLFGTRFVWRHPLFAHLETATVMTGCFVMTRHITGTMASASSTIRKTWSNEEDAALLQLVDDHGPNGAWSVTILGARVPSMCALHPLLKLE